MLDDVSKSGYLDHQDYGATMVFYVPVQYKLDSNQNEHSQLV